MLSANDSVQDGAFSVLSFEDQFQSLTERRLLVGHREVVELSRKVREPVFVEGTGIGKLHLDVHLLARIDDLDNSIDLVYLCLDLFFFVQEGACLLSCCFENDGRKTGKLLPLLFGERELKFLRFVVTLNLEQRDHFAQIFVQVVVERIQAVAFYD